MEAFGSLLMDQVLKMQWLSDLIAHPHQRVHARSASLGDIGNFASPNFIHSFPVRFQNFFSIQQNASAYLRIRRQQAQDCKQ